MKRGSKYYFRARIPSDLLAVYAPRKEIAFSLKTRDPREAREMARIQAVKLDAEFKAKRLELAGKINGDTGRIGQPEIDRLTALWASQFLAEDEKDRIAGLSTEVIEWREEGMDMFDPELRRGLAHGDITPVERPLDEFLREQRVTVHKNSESYRRLGYAFLKTVLEVHEAIRERNDGGIVDHKPPLITAAHSGDVLSDLFEYWQTQHKRKPRTLLEFKTAVARFNKLHGEMPAATIGKAHLVKFKDSLIGRGLARATVVKQLAALRAILQLAVDNEKLKANPASGVRMPKVKMKEKARLPFSVADLNVIFQSPIFTHGERPRAAGGEAAHWLPLLALFTGARLGELGQLHPSDVKELDGVPYLEITDEGDQDGGQRSIKTESSRRRVPIHPELIACGFLEYVSEMRARKAKRLFPALVEDSAGRLTGNWSKWFGRYLRDAIGISDPKKTFHSFRHSFKDACREADIREDVHDALTGHSGGGVGRAYGGEAFPLKPLAKAIERVRYPGMKLK
jgi:integrase